MTSIFDLMPEGTSGAWEIVKHDNLDAIHAAILGSYKVYKHDSALDINQDNITPEQITELEANILYGGNPVVYNDLPSEAVQPVLESYRGYVVEQIEQQFESLTYGDLTASQKAEIEANLLFDGQPVEDIDAHVQAKHSQDIILQRTNQSGTTIAVMSNAMFEIDAHAEVIEAANGDVFIGGLGLGYVANEIAQKSGVDSVDVVEIDSNVIALTGAAIVNEHSNVSVIHNDAYRQLNDNSKKYDIIFFDIFNTDPLVEPSVVSQLNSVAEPRLKEGGKIIYWRIMEPTLINQDPI